MSEPEMKRGEKTREAILNAAEAVFAEQGFDGARIDIIAEVSGYNKTLIFRYFGDKLGLYAEVLKRIDREMTALQTSVAPRLKHESIASDAHTFKAFLETTVGALFDYLHDHPRFLRMLTWEMAEGWQTYAKIARQLHVDDVAQFEPLLHPIQSAGLLRTGVSPLIQMTLILQICQSYLAFLPLYQMLLPGEDIFSATVLRRGREYIVAFIVQGMVAEQDSAAGESTERRSINRSKARADDRK